MFSSVLSADVRGITGMPIWVETDVSDGLPGLVMVGYLASAVRESADRVRTAMKNTGVSIPPKKITVNLSPADTKKEGTGFDLAIAVSLMCSLGMFPKECIEKVMFLGELGLDGTVKKIRGVLPMAELAKELGCAVCVIPKDNEAEGRIVKGIACVGVENLRETLNRIITGDYSQEDISLEIIKETQETNPDFFFFFGQEGVKQAAKLAAAGRLNLLMVGPPGSGKTMIARRIPTILPQMSEEESLEVTKIYSVCGLLPEGVALMKDRPFRAPHHTISVSAMVGGGRQQVMPGEISLSNHGCLFLDEITEIPRNVLESLRQPLEDRCVQISRVSGNAVFPANTMLIAAMNPCRCGYYPDMNKCHCNAGEIHRYLNKISMPFIDRMDLCVEAPRVAFEELTGEESGETSEKIREKVLRAHQMQTERYQGSAYRFNGDVKGSDVEEYFRVGKEQKKLLEDAFENLNLTARSYHKILKVARTAADLECEKDIEVSHILQAICYRNIDRKFWAV